MTSVAHEPATEGPIRGHPRWDVRRLAIGLVRGPADELAWVRPALIGVLVLAAVVDVWDLTISGYANTYYAAAAQAASKSWSAFFFGSFDAANFITVDKPPLAIWPMALSVKLFGLSSWSILLPQALAGIATVALLYATVRRSFGPLAATIAGVVMALTPVAVLIFRFDNPDAVLTLLSVGAAAAVLRAVEDGRVRWAVLAGALIGLAFLTKYLQAYVVLPVFAALWLFAVPGSLGRRLYGLTVAAVTVVLTSGWWVAIVEAIPAGARPYIGGSTNGSPLDLIFGYDGLGRIFGSSGPGGGPGGGGGFGGEPGLLRMFNAQFGGQVSWLIPLAVIGLAIGLWMRGRRPRTDRRRAATLLWGGWLAINVLVFSLMSGIIHPYYTVMLAPAIAALVGAGLVDLWALRSRTALGGLLLGTSIMLTAVWAFLLLERTPDFLPGLGLVVVIAAAVASVLVAVPPTARTSRIALTGMAVGLAALLAGPAAYSATTVASAHAGGDPAAGPATSDFGSSSFGPGAAFGRGGPAPGGGAIPGGAIPGGGFPGGVPGGAGGIGGATAGDALTSYLVANQGAATWIVAVNGSQEAGAIELATGLPVMAMGGFNGSDPTPTLAELQQYVASGQLRFVIVGGAGGRGGGPGFAGASDSSAISSWVTAACTAVDLGSGASSGLYDCAGAGS